MGARGQRRSDTDRDSDSEGEIEAERYSKEVAKAKRTRQTRQEDDKIFKDKSKNCAERLLE